MVFPEGVKGTGKPFSERYRLQRFGRGGFVEIALRTGAPIVPVAVVGSEEIYPKLADSRAARAGVGAPFVPITPTFPWLGPLGLIPLPSSGGSSSASRSTSRRTARRPPTTGASCSTSPSRCARRSRTRLYENLVKRRLGLPLEPAARRPQIGASGENVRIDSSGSWAARRRP